MLKLQRNRSIRGVLIQSCSSGATNFNNYVFCHPQFRIPLLFVNTTNCHNTSLLEGPKQHLAQHYDTTTPVLQQCCSAAALKTALHMSQILAKHDDFYQNFGKYCQFFRFWQRMMFFPKYWQKLMLFQRIYQNLKNHQFLPLWNFFYFVVKIWIISNFFQCFLKFIVFFTKIWNMLLISSVLFSVLQHCYSTSQH